MTKNNSCDQAKNRKEYKDEYQTFFPSNNKANSTATIALFTYQVLLTEGKSMYGTEILKKIASISPIWTPSHGTHQSVLDTKTDEGKLSRTKNGGKTFFTVTELGKKDYQEILANMKPKLEGFKAFFETALAILNKQSDNLNDCSSNLADTDHIELLKTMLMLGKHCKDTALLNGLNKIKKEIQCFAEQLTVIK